MRADAHIHARAFSRFSSLVVATSAGLHRVIVTDPLYAKQCIGLPIPHKQSAFYARLSFHRQNEFQQHRSRQHGLKVVVVYSTS